MSPTADPAAVEFREPVESCRLADRSTTREGPARPARRRLHVLIGSDYGMTTAEYAVGTVAACGFGGVLYKVVTSDQVAKLISDVIKRALTMTF